jgi:hypothetical protein
MSTKSARLALPAVKELLVAMVVTRLYLDSYLWAAVAELTQARADQAAVVAVHLVAQALLQVVLE